MATYALGAQVFGCRDPIWKIYLPDRAFLQSCILFLLSNSIGGKILAIAYATSCGFFFSDRICSMVGGNNILIPDILLSFMPIDSHRLIIPCGLPCYTAFIECCVIIQRRTLLSLQHEKHKCTKIVVLDSSEIRRDILIEDWASDILLVKLL